MLIRRTLSMAAAARRSVAAAALPQAAQQVQQQRQQPQPQHQPQPQPQEEGRAVDTLLFDLDGTLYNAACGYMPTIRRNLFTWMAEEMRHYGIKDEAHAEEVWRPLYKQYNQFERGCKARGWEIDSRAYWRAIRAGGERFLTPQPETRSFVRSLPQRKFIHTNCNEEMAEHALQLLGLEDCFDGVFGSEFMGEYCKPEPQAFEKVLHCIGSDPTRTVMFEDSAKNLQTARELGMATVLVGTHTANEEGVDLEENAHWFDVRVEDLSNTTEVESKLGSLRNL